MSVRSIMFGLVLFLTSGSLAAADTTRCEYRSWEGAPQNVAKDIIGDGFELRVMENSVLAVRFFLGSGVSDWVGIQRVIEGPDFITYRARGSDFGYDGSDLSFRLYENGTCFSALTDDRYYPVRGTGNY